MDSALWAATAGGNVEQIRNLFEQHQQHQQIAGQMNGPAMIDLEMQDAAGLTFLIHAIKSDCVEAVKELLYRGANPLHASSQGPPESFTSNEKILLELESARAHFHMGQHQAYHNQHQQHQHQLNHHHHHHQRSMSGPQEVNQNPEKSPFLAQGQVMGQDQQHMHFQNPAFFYPNMDAQNMHYQGMPMPQANFYHPYAAPEQVVEAAKEAQGQLPPTEVARQIPCRFFPDCRYGNECAFYHPTSPSSTSAAGGPPRYPFQMQSPQLGNTSAMPFFDPALMPAYGYPPPFFGAMSPSMNAAQFGGPASPMFVPSGQGLMSPALAQDASLPSEHQYIGSPGDHESHSNALNLNIHEGETTETSDSANVKRVQFDIAARSLPMKDVNGKKGRKSSSSINKPVFPDNHPRDGTLPPCAFFSSGAGKCRNGDTCKFPHLLPDGTDCRDPVMAGTAPLSVIPHANKPVARAHKQVNVGGNNNANTTGNNTRQGAHRTEKKASSSHGVKNSENTAHNSKTARAAKHQKVPTPDDFPSLMSNKSSAAPSMVSSVQSLPGSKGLTAAQILAQAPVKSAAPATTAVSKQSESENGSTSESSEGSIVMVSSVVSLTNSEDDLVHVHSSKSSNNSSSHLPSHVASFAATVSA